MLEQKQWHFWNLHEIMHKVMEKDFHNSSKNILLQIKGQKISFWEISVVLFENLSLSEKNDGNIKCFSIALFKITCKF